MESLETTGISLAVILRISDVAQVNGCVGRLGCLAGAALRCWTRERKVAGSTPGRGAIKSTRSTQPFIPPG